MKKLTTKMLCRAGIIAALYVALTYAFGALAYNGFLQIRPAEALTILPLFFPEAIPALYIGCMLSNIASPFWVYDVFVGSLATLVAAVGTWGMGKIFCNHVLRIAVGGLFPVLINAFVIPVIIVFCAEISPTAPSPQLLDVFRLACRDRSALGLCTRRTTLCVYSFHAQKRCVRVLRQHRRRAPAGYRRTTEKQITAFAVLPPPRRFRLRGGSFFAARAAFFYKIFLKENGDFY